MALEDEDGLFPNSYGGSKGLGGSKGMGLGDIGMGLGSVIGSFFGDSNSEDDDLYKDIIDNSKLAGDRMLGGIDKYLADILSQTTSQYSKGSAIADSQGAVAEIFNQFKNSALPEIYQAQAGSGGYNSSTGQLLANDAFASANTKAASLVLDTINKYRGIQQQDYAGLANLGKAVPSAPGRAPKGGGGGGESDPLGDLLGAGIGAALSFFSDERLKENIKPVGTRNGHNLYEFNYIADPNKIKYVGVMAQEVAQTNPEAVKISRSGFMMVNYGVLDIPFERAAQ